MSRMAIRSQPTLKQMLKDKKIRIGELAEMTGYSRQSISSFVKGKCVGYKLAFEVARVLEVDKWEISEMIIIE